MIAKSRPQHMPGELLVRFKNPSSNEGLLNSNSAIEGLGRVEARYPLGNKTSLQDSYSSSEILHVKLNDTSEAGLESAIQQLHQDSRVAYAVTNDILQPFGDNSARRIVPNDLHPELYGLERISAPVGWADTSGDQSRAPLVAVIDSGTDYNHPDLMSNIWTNPKELANGKDDDGNGVIDDIHGFNAVDKNGDPMDSGSHGTHVAGTVAASGNNGLGVTGVAWEARLMPLKFISGGMGNMADAIAALTYADSQGARITQNSWGGSNANQALVDALAASPALHICAAGNDGNNSDIKPLYPAAYGLDNILAVAATDHEDKLASFSNYGLQAVDLAAPGVKTYSTIPGGEYGFKSGTSMATPHVSGVASLVLTKFPELTNAQLKDRLMFSTDRLEGLEGKIASGGRLNLARALENDKVPPGQVEELHSSDITSSSAVLGWKASGDDGTLGRAAAYEIAYSDKAFSEDVFHDQSQIYTKAPKVSGTPETARLELTPSARDRNIFVGLRAVDNVGNRAPMQSLQVHIPKANVAFEDSRENWTSEGEWGQETVTGRGQVWSDSPGGSYERDRNASLTSKSFSLKDYQTASLQFDCRHDLEINFDKVFLETRHGGPGAPWSQLKAFNLLDGWHTEKFDLSNLAGEDDVQIRFRLKTDGDVFLDGFQFDRLVVTGVPKTEPCPSESH